MNAIIEQITQGRMVPVYGRHPARHRWHSGRLLANTLLGASGGFENIAGMIGKAVAPGLSTTPISTMSCRLASPGRHPAGRGILWRHARRSYQRHLQMGQEGCYQQR